MPARDVERYLSDHTISYRLVPHAPAYTALETAQSAHVSGHKLAKAVVVLIDGLLAMVVLPASHHLDLNALHDSIRCFDIELADEKQFQSRLVGCEPGAIPALGPLYSMEVYLAQELEQQSEIVFCAGSHTELIGMSTADYKKLVSPVIISFGSLPTGQTPPRMLSHHRRF